MAKLTLLVFVVLTVVFGFFNTAESLNNVQEAQERDANPEEENENERSGAYAFARATTITASPRQQQRTQVYQTALVECYACTDCPQILPNTTTKMCPRTLDPSKQSTCVVYSEQYRHLKKNWYIRGCATERGSCADIKQGHAGHSGIVKLLTCTECEGDRCNTSGTIRSLSDLTIAIVTLLIPFLTKCVIS